MASTTARKTASAADLRRDPIIAKLVKAVGTAPDPDDRDYVRLQDKQGHTVAWVLKRKNYARLIGLKKALPHAKQVGAGKTRGVLVTEKNVDRVAEDLHAMVADAPMTRQRKAA